MIQPVLQDDEFLADVQTARQERNRLHLWWLGQSGFLVVWQGHAILLDPYLSDSLTRKYAGTDKPHVRMTGRVIPPEKLNFIEAVTSTHNHTDHLDGETLTALRAVNSNLAIIVSRANLQFAANRLGMAPDDLVGIRTDGEPVKIGPFSFRALPAAHETLSPDEHGDQHFIGYLIEVGEYTLYQSGDCCLYDGLVERLRATPLDLAMLPINGRDPKRGVAGNFSAAEAVALAQQAQIGLVVPCHYEMFEFNTVDPGEFEQLAKREGVPYRRLQAGERMTL